MINIGNLKIKGQIAGMTIRIKGDTIYLRKKSETSRRKLKTGDVFKNTRETSRKMSGVTRMTARIYEILKITSEKSKDLTVSAYPKLNAPIMKRIGRDGLKDGRTIETKAALEAIGTADIMKTKLKETIDTSRIRAEMTTEKDRTTVRIRIEGGWDETVKQSPKEATWMEMRLRIATIEDVEWNDTEETWRYASGNFRTDSVTIRMEKGEAEANKERELSIEGKIGDAERLIMVCGVSFGNGNGRIDERDAAGIVKNLDIRY